MKAIMTVAMAMLLASAGSAAQYTITNLGTLGGNYSSACAINDSGTVVGWSYTSQYSEHAFIYYGGVMHDLDSLVGLGYGSDAYGISNSGDVVGSYRTASGGTYAFLYDGTVHDLGSLGGGGSAAGAVNNIGEVVGYALTSAGVADAFLYNDGTMNDLGGASGVGLHVGICYQRLRHGGWNVQPCQRGLPRVYLFRWGDAGPQQRREPAVRLDAECRRRNK